VSVNRVAVANNESEVRFPRERFRQSLRRPVSGRRCRNAELEDPTPRKIEDHEDKEKLEANRRNDCEIDGDGFMKVIS
jgi:hypothetical protein